MKQESFASLTYRAKKRKTRRERFLEQMQACVPWTAFEAIIEPHYPTSGRRGGQPIGLKVMLRIYLMQQWFSLSDPMMEDSLYEIELMRRTRKANQWYFGMKIHVGADVNCGSAHTVTVTAANEADIHQLPNLLREADEVIFGDAGYASDRYKRGARQLGLHWKVNDKRKPGSRGNLSAAQRKRNRKQSRIRARVEHLFRIIKCQFGYRKVRYRGLEKNRVQVMSLMAMANLYLQRRALGA